MQTHDSAASMSRTASAMRVTRERMDRSVLHVPRDFTRTSTAPLPAHSVPTIRSHSLGGHISAVASVTRASQDLTVGRASPVCRVFSRIQTVVPLVLLVAQENSLSYPEASMRATAWIVAWASMQYLPNGDQHWGPQPAKTAWRGLFQSRLATSRKATASNVLRASSQPQLAPTHQATARIVSQANIQWLLGRALPRPAPLAPPMHYRPRAVTKSQTASATVATPDLMEVPK